MKQVLFTRIEKPFILKSTMDVLSFGDWINGAKSTKDGQFIAHLDGQKMQTKQSLFEEFAAQLKFPDYFGENWDAFDECINDLSWLDAKSFVIGISMSEQILSLAEEKDQRIFGELLKDVCEAWSQPYDEDKEWGRPGRPFHIVMQCQDEKQLARFGNIFEPN